jgi:hypothetical protein
MDNGFNNGRGRVVTFGIEKEEMQKKNTDRIRTKLDMCKQLSLTAN